MSSSFRASPWVTYEPTTTIYYNRQQQQPSESEMDEEVDMEAPQISTLREEETPPPQSSKKLIINPRKRPAAPPDDDSIEAWIMTKRKKESNEDEDEEDQLIDELIDDDDDPAKPSPSSQPGRSTESASKRKTVAKKKARKSDKKPGEGEKKVKEKGSQPTGAHNLAPTMSCFKANLAESHEDIEIVNSSPTNHPGGESSVPKAKKKASPRKPATIPRAKAKLAKQKSAIPLLFEDSAVLSESYAGTAASSPVTAHFEQNSPEPENIPASSPHPASAPLIEEPNLENVPIPVYPLPTKPFPVQPPQKIVSGFAPLLPLDRSNKKVRHWREANREIRGIAGGRWLARSWVGDKESEYSAHVAATNQAKTGDEKANTVAIPKLSSVSISAPASSKVLNKLKITSKSGSTVTSANPSRATSAIPEVQGVSITNTVRAPTKMRILQLAPSSEGGESDMAPVNDT